MAHMFPKTFPSDNLSSGEKKVFEFLKLNAPSNWYVFHSFRLPKHKYVVFGEADFVIVAPGYGIFILEIKSGGVGFDGSDWLFINRNREITRKKRGPFQQAREAMFEMEGIISGKLGKSYDRLHLLYGYGVIFTDEENFPVQTMIEDEPWRLCQNTNNVDYCKFVRTLSKKFQDELYLLGKSTCGLIDDKEAEIIAKTLRPLIDCIAPLKSFIKSSEDDIISLTEEQYACLDDIELNEQIVITGGAGTGKTLIAVEDARRSSEVLQRIGSFCYNKNLSKYIRLNIQNANVDVYSFHSYLLKLCDTSSVIGDIADEKYYSEILPDLAYTQLATGIEKYDKLIIDEFQDLCTISYLKVFDAILNGGLINGRFSFYGDFARQSIYNSSVTLDTLKSYAFFARKGLSINCRNTLYIGNELINITGYNDKNYKLRITGEPVDYFVWDSYEKEKMLLADAISKYRQLGFKSESIVILSPYKRCNSIVGQYDEKKYVICDYGDSEAQYYARFSTIQAFKGLESEIVVLVDIDSYVDTQLMYIALSRARSKMIVLESVNASKERKSNLIKR